MVAEPASSSMAISNPTVPIKVLQNQDLHLTASPGPASTPSAPSNMVAERGCYQAAGQLQIKRRPLQPSQTQNQEPSSHHHSQTSLSIKANEDYNQSRRKSQSRTSDAGRSRQEGTQSQQSVTPSSNEVPQSEKQAVLKAHRRPSSKTKSKTKG